MLNKIIKFSIENKLMVALMTLALVIWGTYSLYHLPIDAVPDITNNQVQVITRAPSQSAEDIERLVTFPLEQQLSTLPLKEEIRSMSRFGLSVITVVFEEGTDIYWARQQVSERLQQISGEIPPDLGIPEMAPVSTGLGEIYQYVLKVDSAYRDSFDLMELRSIQDWIVRRQLLGLEGVADVSSFGGKLKQYEVAIRPEALQSFHMSVTEIFDALQRNNANTGGAYIDKSPQAYFIRTEGLLSSLDDVRSIPIKLKEDGLPIYIRDVATVQFGYANRYGALTYNAEGESVGAIVMMLKGENSNAVVNRVKSKISEIEKTLPKGVHIEAFLDRSDLVNRAISTVKTNLMEGALIVILVLVLFLGNLRAGLLVASVIPLALLFAISMMQLFGVSGNLMSLGAIDFGLVVDGAVIIVEATMHHLGLRKWSGKMSRKEMDEEVFNSASKIRNSAAFGEIIILIVYLPILALVGVEGKMFKPMAQTVSFAILGAFLLSLTYVPMLSSVLLSRKQPKETLTDRIMAKLQLAYGRLLAHVLKVKAWVIGTAIALFAISLVLFLRMGGEFIPTLEEGDFALEVRLLPGSSLEKTTRVSLDAAELLLRKFPDEIAKVIGKVGTSEIPTDPMPLEACDLMVILKPQDQWTQASTQNGLAELMQEELALFAGVNFGFQQPIQMRFNELMTGVKQDVAVKIFGHDLKTLSSLAKQTGALASSVEGVQDIYVEEVDGISQIVIKVNRLALSRYGLSVQEVNTLIESTLAGKIAGLVYEGEKRFDLTVRLDKSRRQSINDIESLFLHGMNGVAVPLSAVATIDEVASPNQIQRENAARRIVVGFNVRNRDVQSVVEEIQAKMNEKIEFPSGYYPAFGGQFENLQEAQARLSIAVPIALALILLLLYLSFSSISHALLIFSSIPMAAIGGVFALYLRDMPFSISAGVGFIALFGVAVLNGIVLIAEYRHRQKEDPNQSLLDLIISGSQTRIRPVLMTACVASLGFLPMAISQSAGAEVQRPLATVVIGGLVSSTLLTLFVLPSLFYWLSNRKRKATTVVTILFISLLSANQSHAQSITLQEAIKVMNDSNPELQAAQLKWKAMEARIGNSVVMPDTRIGLQYGQYNSYIKTDNSLQLTQEIPFPAKLSSGRAVDRASAQRSKMEMDLLKARKTWELRDLYAKAQFYLTEMTVLETQDSLLVQLENFMKLRYQAGEIGEYEYLRVKNKLESNRLEKLQNELLFKQVQQSTQSLLFKSDSLVFSFSDSIPAFTVAQANTPELALQEALMLEAKKRLALSKQGFLPDLELGYTNQTLEGNPLSSGVSGPLADAGTRFQVFQAGIRIPLFFGSKSREIQARKLEAEAEKLNFEAQQLRWDQEYKRVIANLGQIQEYRQQLNSNSDEVWNKGLLALKTRLQSGSIRLGEFLLELQDLLQFQRMQNRIQQEYQFQFNYYLYLQGNL
ncbi:MAG: CusA/CzcA family heavy metal efflux RND transporter [Bacteroidetes bacterium]|nr:MAG: CusA/CzcA family heavy metal efflux RND transporter [Bacteroidota bacterium]